MATYNYREQYPSYLSTREFWDSGAIKPKDLDPKEFIRVCEARARQSANSLHAEVYGSDDETVSSHAQAD